jgi:YVTN family beta-propeller protein
MVSMKICALVFCLSTLWACGSRDIDRPSIEAVNPSEAQVKSEVTITGHNFVDNYSQTFVRFNGKEALPRDFVSINDNEIVIRVPNEGTNGPLSIKVSDETSNSVDFTVFGPWAYVVRNDNVISAVDSYNLNVNHSFTVDDIPDLVVFTPEGDKAYLLTFSQPLVTVVDAPRGRILHTIALSANPVDMALTLRKNHRAFISHGTEGTITVVDTLTDSVEQVISIIADPGKLVVDRLSQRLLVVNRSDNTIQALNVEDFAVRGTSTTLSGRPEKLFLSPANDRLISLNSAANTISIVTVNEARFVADIAVGKSPVSGAYTAAGTTFYVVNNGDNTVSFVDVVDKKVTSTINVGAAPVEAALGPDSLYVYVANSGDNTVTAISLLDNSTHTINVGSNPRHLGGVDGPGDTMNRIFVLNQGSGTVSVINVSDNTVEATIAVGDSPSLMAVESLVTYPPDQKDIIKR